MIVEAEYIIPVGLFITGSLAGVVSWSVKRTLNGSVQRIVEIGTDLKEHIVETRVNFKEAKAARDEVMNTATGIDKRLAIVEQTCLMRDHVRVNRVRPEDS